MSDANFETTTSGLTVVLATSNPGKLSELRRLFRDLPIQFRSASEVLGKKFSVNEDGETFEANAILKARAVAELTRSVGLADDSGLEVDALAGRPGVRSARFAHEHASDAENNTALLKALEAFGPGERSARFRCVLALAEPESEKVQIVEGRLEGTIARALRGSAGFGYDPLFVVDAVRGRTLAELTPDEKNALSHRGRAALALRPHLERLVKAASAAQQRDR